MLFVPAEVGTVRWLEQLGVLCTQPGQALWFTVLAYYEATFFALDGSRTSIIIPVSSGKRFKPWVTGLS